MELIYVTYSKDRQSRSRYTLLYLGINHKNQMVCIDSRDVNNQELKLLKESYNNLRYQSDFVNIAWAEHNMPISMKKRKTLTPGKARIHKRYELFTKA